MEEFCRRVREGLDQATWEQKRQLIEWLVVRVIVTDGEVEIRYAIPTRPRRRRHPLLSVACRLSSGSGHGSRSGARSRPATRKPPPASWVSSVSPPHSTGSSHNRP